MPSRKVVAHAVAAAGNHQFELDDEALRPATDALSAVLAIRGDAARSAITEESRQAIPPPTLAAFTAAHVARNSP